MIDDIRPVSRKTQTEKITPTVLRAANQEPSFRPPEQVAVQETVAAAPLFSANDSNVKRNRNLVYKFKQLGRPQKIIVLTLIGLLVLGGGGAGAWFAFIRKPAPPPPVAIVAPEPPPPPPAPTTLPSPLTGVEVAPELAKRPVTGVMIENSPEARPQAALKDAGIVFEAVAEGGITRFLALFQEAKPDHIGPVRSVRPYYLDWVAPFDAGIVHAGGSGEALAQLRAGGLKDLDHGANGSFFQRVTNRYAPHNLYTSMTKLDELNTSKGFTSSTFTSWPRKAEAPNAAPTAKSIDIKISSTNYNVHYDYDPATNNYKRALGGKPHNDERSGSQLTPKVVMALVMPRSIHSDRVHTVYNTSGSGAVTIFQDGVITTGTWHKADRKGQFQFKDAAGAEIKFNPGQTWLSMVNAASDITHTP